MGQRSVLALLICACVLVCVVNGKATSENSTSALSKTTKSSAAKNLKSEILSPAGHPTNTTISTRISSHVNKPSAQARSWDEPDSTTSTSNGQSVNPPAKSLASPEEKSFMDFDSLPISPMGGYKKYQKSYINMPGYNMAKEKVDGGGLQPVAGMVPFGVGGMGPGMIGPGLGYGGGPGMVGPGLGYGGGGPGFGYGGGPGFAYQQGPSVYGGGLPAHGGPMVGGNTGMLDPGMARFINTMRQRSGFPGNTGFGLSQRSPPLSKPLPNGCKCSKIADCRDVSAFARDFGDDQGTFNGHCLPGFMVCCNPEAQDQLNMATIPRHAKSAVNAIPGLVASPLVAPVIVGPNMVAASVPGAPVVKLPPPTNFNPEKKILLGSGNATALSGKSGLEPVGATCGNKGRNPLGRVLDNVNSRADTDFGEFPWMAAVLLPDLTYVCGGALVGNQFIVTAAHCVNRHKDRNLIVRLGEYDVTNTDEPPYQDIKVSDVLIHSEFHAGTLANDIAMLVLEAPVVYNDYISPVCLPEPDFVPSVSCTVTGWGKDSISHGKWANRLKSVDVPMITHASCEGDYRKAPQLGNDFNLASSFVCAGSPGKDACYGDGGSPLVCSKDPDSEKGFKLLGLVAWGIDCGKYPGVYVRIQSVVPWILDAMKQFGGTSN